MGESDNASDRPPVAFISYSWDSEEHRQWVLELASRLRAEGGVHVVLDRWDLPPGGDRALFTEKSVADSDFVILICTPNYAQRSNGREGGVGYEATVITGQLAEDIGQTKFIPTLRNGDWKSSIPNWIKSKLGIDMRGDPYPEGRFRELVRALHGERLKPPPVGPKPDFASDEALSLAKPLTKLGEAGFIYSGEAIGGRWVPAKPGPPAQLFPLPDAPIPNSVIMEGTWDQYLDYELEPHLALGNTIRYAAQIPGPAAVYAYIHGSRKEDLSKHDRWIQHELGTGEEATEGTGEERKVYVPGTPLRDGWLSFDISLSEGIRRAFPELNLSYRRAIKLRLRGPLSISPISVYRDS